MRDQTYQDNTASVSNGIAYDVMELQRAVLKASTFLSDIRVRPDPQMRKKARRTLFVDDEAEASDASADRSDGEGDPALNGYEDVRFCSVTLNLSHSCILKLFSDMSLCARRTASSLEMLSLRRSRGPADLRARLCRRSRFATPPSRRRSVAVRGRRLLPRWSYSRE